MELFCKQTAEVAEIINNRLKTNIKNIGAVTLKISIWLLLNGGF